MHKERARLILEDGTQFTGEGFGASQTVMVELVFNTSMVGYQEILSDPSYTDQAVVMTYPLIGNYGINEDDYETRVPSIAGLVVREYNDDPSNFRCTETLDQVMKRYGIVGITGVDTRKITRHLRNFGSCKAMITRESEEELSLKEACEQMHQTPLPTDAVARVSTKEAYTFEDSKAEEEFHIVAIDCGIKLNILRMLARKHCRITVVPWNTGAEEILAYQPDGVFLSNGPGDPAVVTETIKTVEQLLGKVPIFGICLGHQILCLAYHAKTYKLKFGHRGGNHPVKNLLTDKIEITSQNHSYAVEEDSVKEAGLEVTHVNLLDGTIEGMQNKADFVCSVQYHPESAPGPQDSSYLFENFLKNMNDWKERTSHAEA